MSALSPCPQLSLSGSASLGLFCFPVPLQAEAGRAQLELSITKLRAEEASLRDSLSKMSALNESLAQDKLELNRLIAQVCCVPAPGPLHQGDTAEAYRGSTPYPVCPAVQLSSCLPFCVSVLCIIEGCSRGPALFWCLVLNPMDTLLSP